MNPADLAALHRLCFTYPRPWDASEFAALMDLRGSFVLGDARGFALGRAVADEVELLSLAVHPEFRRQGIGRARLAAFEAEGQRRGAGCAHLEVAADNAAARALYAAAGYRETGCRPGYYATPCGSRVDALILSKRLGV